ncbi:hypothetical protein WMY93_021686 [Mugilogobius chulae]|uniref:Interferon-related developmental regulator N-terminal domain-containing protein n=1 Tax=Mugilogobius chulae TaxID=88201 RepID=A0AAW0NFP3_9GOBI
MPRTKKKSSKVPRPTGALDGLKTAMANRILYEFISERRMTITDSIERCLKKGKDGSANIQARQAVATSLGLCTLVAEDDILDVFSTMECFESLFTRSYAKGDGTVPSVNPQTSQLHTNALLSWALLLTICSGSQLKEVLRKHMPKLPGLLESEDVNMRIAAGRRLLCFLNWPETWTL